jgi:branched-chain amino acid aminotransferase
MDKKQLINLNGQLFPSKEPIFGADNRAFRYGDALFETIRMIGGKLPLLHLHLPRLVRGCELLRLKMDKSFNADFFQQQINLLAEARGISEARIRLTLFRTAGGYYLPASSQTEYLIEIEKVEGQGFEYNEKGLSVDLFTEIEKPATQFSTFKTANALVYVLAAMHKKDRELDDCLLINSKSRVIESIDSNLFLVEKGELHTPPVAEGCVAGVMREHLISLAEKEGIAWHEMPLTLEELFSAEEMFLSNAINGIRWVEHYKSKQYSNDLSARLHKSLRKSVS